MLTARFRAACLHKRSRILDSQAKEGAMTLWRKSARGSPQMHTDLQTGYLPEASGTNTAMDWRILEAVRYLDQCRAAGRCLAVVTGESPESIRLVLQRFLAGVDSSSKVARICAPTDCRHGFLQALLSQLGFEPFESSADDLQRLLNVVLRQAMSQHSTTVILVEDAGQFGPRVLELLRELIRDARELNPPPLFVLAGRPSLHRVLDSRGMASLAGLAQHRFDLAPPDAAAGAASVLPTEADPCLVLTLDSAERGRFPVRGEHLLIGRGEHCDIPILSRFVSRQHALFLRNDSGDWIVDLKSTNGTSVNSTLIRQRRLAHGDIISIGNHRLRYHNPAAPPRLPGPEPADEQLGETTVMRSLQPVIRPEDGDRHSELPGKPRRLSRA